MPGFFVSVVNPGTECCGANPGQIKSQVFGLAYLGSLQICNLQQLVLLLRGSENPKQPLDGADVRLRAVGVHTTSPPSLKEYGDAFHAPDTSVPAHHSHCPPKGLAMPLSMPKTVSEAFSSKPILSKNKSKARATEFQVVKSEK